MHPTSQKDLLCWPVGAQMWGFANMEDVDGLIHYLTTLVDHNINCGVKEWGPDGCIRVACAKASAIFWCNDVSLAFFSVSGIVRVRERQKGRGPYKGRT